MKNFVKPPRIIGLFDSGVGGLTLLRKLVPLFPQSTFIYLADTAHVPYGNKSPQEICLYTSQCLEWLKAQGAEFIVVACNTSASVAFDVIKRCTLPFLIPLDPVLNLFSQPLHTGIERLVIWATSATVKSGMFEIAFKERFPQLSIKAVACPELVPLIEAGNVQGQEIEAVVRDYLNISLQGEDRVSTILYGCTHYPFIDPIVKAISKNTIQSIDPADAVALYMRKLFHQSGPEKKSQGIQEKPCLHFAVTGHPDQFLKAAQLFLGEEILRLASIKCIYTHTE